MSDMAGGQRNNISISQEESHTPIKQNAVSKISFALFSQGMLGVMAVLTSIVLPRQMGPEQYGYYQSFAFYVTYLNMLGFGLNDGITLNYAGKGQGGIPLPDVRRAIQIQGIYAAGLSLLIMAASRLFFRFPRDQIIFMLGVNLIPTILFCIMNAIFLAENRSYLYNISNVIQRAAFCLILLVILAAGRCSAYNVILAFTIAAIAILPVLLPKCRAYVIGEKSGWSSGWKEYKKLCISGFKIALSISLTGLIPIFGRVMIENHESMENYGIFSFYTGLLSIVLTFTNAVGIVAFPIMRNSDQSKLAGNYLRLEAVYAFLGMAMFLVYPFCVFFINKFMPSYSPGICYFPCLFVVCYPMGKIQMLIFPYYKTERKENELFYVNMLSFLLTVCVVCAAYRFFPGTTSVAIGTAISCMAYFFIISIFLPIQGGQNKVVCILDWLTPLTFYIIATRFSGIGLFFRYMSYMVIAGAAFAFHHYTGSKKRKGTNLDLGR